MDRNAENALATTNHIHIKERRSYTSDAVDLIFRVLPTYDFYFATNVLRVELHIEGVQKDQRLIRRWSQNRQEIFTVRDEDWQASELEQTVNPTVTFHITRGTSIRPASSEFTPLRGSQGSTLTLRYSLVSKQPIRNTIASAPAASERSLNVDIDNDTSDDAPRSPGSEYFEAEEGDKTLSVHGNSERVGTDDRADGLARLDQATRAIFMDELQSSGDPTPAHTPFRTSTPAQLTTKTDAESFHNIECNGERSTFNDTVLDHQNIRHASGTIDRYLSSVKNGAQSDTNNGRVDRDIDETGFASSIKPTVFTNNRHRGAPT